MHPSAHAARHPSRAAIVMASTGQVIDYAALEALSAQSAHLLRALGLRRGDGVATLFDNGPEVFVFGLAAQRSGLYLTSISNKLSVADIGYILKDCGATLLVASGRYGDIARQAIDLVDDVRLVGWSDGIGSGPSWTTLASGQPEEPIPDQSPGTDMLYSSGTTGRPKGVKFPLPEGGIDHRTPLMAMGADLYGMGEDTIYLSTSPLYHAAPQRWAMTVGITASRNDRDSSAAICSLD